MKRTSQTVGAAAAGFLVGLLLLGASACTGPANPPSAEASPANSAPVSPAVIPHPLGPPDPATLLASASPLPPAPIDQVPAAGCGVERQALKVGRDAGARGIALTPRDTTIAALAAASSDLSSVRSSPVETTVWRLRVRLLAYKGEADSDYHLVIADSSGTTMIAEIASPDCDGGTAWDAQLRQTRSDFDARYTATSRFRYLDVPVTIVGVGFFDVLHGQRGVAPNGVEIHPVLAITFG